MGNKTNRADRDLKFETLQLHAGQEHPERMLFTNPARTSEEIICSKYLTEIACRSAASFRGTGAAAPFMAISSIRRSAYFALVGNADGMDIRRRGADVCHCRLCGF